MAWRAELLRRCWYCIVGMDAVHAYSNKLREDWWISLTPEERERILEEKEQQRQKDNKELNTAIAKMLITEAAVFSAYCKHI